MPPSQPIWRIIRRPKRTPFVCADCQQWLTRQTLAQQRRTISQAHLGKIKTAEGEWQNRQDAIAQGGAKSILEKLEERGLVNQVVGNRDELNKTLVERRVGAYCGVDPTAASLHVGHMVPFMALGWMYIHGYAANFLLGGFTASIGDPTDRLSARPEQARADRVRNIGLMFDQLKRLAVSMENYAERRGFHREWAWRKAILNNNSWWNKLTVKDYMKVLGTCTRVGPMLGRDSVKNRLTKGDGMSYAEFSYPLIQAWDWWHQYQTGTQIQIGGGDQFGNILAGAEAVKAIVQTDSEYYLKHQNDMKGYEASFDPMGFTVPLLTTSSGEKFGKSAGNAIWIDPNLTSSYDLYQFFLRSADEDVEKYLKLLTFMPLPKISSIMDNHRKDESQRLAQHSLAFDFVELVHGLEAAGNAEQQHKAAFSKDLSFSDVKAQLREKPDKKLLPDGRPADLHPSLNKHAAPLNMDSVGDLNIKLPRSLVVQQPLPRILWSAGLVASRSEGQRLINNKGVYVGGKIGTDGNPAPMEDLVEYIPAKSEKWSYIEPLVIDNILVLRTGKWKKKFIQIVSDEEYEASGETCPGWKEEAESAADPMIKADLAGEVELRKRRSKDEVTAEQKKQDYYARESRGFGTITGAKFRR